MAWRSTWVFALKTGRIQHHRMSQAAARLKARKSRRVAFFLFCTPLLVPFTLLVISRLQTRPVFEPPAGARIEASKNNPFYRMAGPVYMERLTSSHPPHKFWQEMRPVFHDAGAEIDSTLEPMNGNYIESRDHHQESFKVLGLPQVPLRPPAFHGTGLLRKAHFKIYLWGDAKGGSVMEIWIMDDF